MSLHNVVIGSVTDLLTDESTVWLAQDCILAELNLQGALNPPACQPL